MRVYANSAVKKMADRDNNKMMRFLIIDGRSLLLSQEHINKKEKTKTVGVSLDKKER